MGRLVVPVPLLLAMASLGSAAEGEEATRSASAAPSAEVTDGHCSLSYISSYKFPAAFLFHTHTHKKKSTSPAFAETTQRLLWDEGFSLALLSLSA